MVDTASLGARRRVLAHDGTLIPNSGNGGRWVASLGRIVRARLLSPFVSQTLRPFLSVYRRADLVALRDLIAAGNLTPVVGRTVALEDTPAAVEDVGRGHARGKVVVTL